jgi:hypothetical protein
MKTNKISSAIAAIALCLLPAMQTARAADNPIRITHAAEPGSFPLVAAGQAATLIVDANDLEVVTVAATAFSNDVEMITGTKPVISGQLSTNAVIIGTLGASTFIDRLAESGKLDPVKLQDKWETFLISVVENPLPDVSKALIIAGSDPRGTAFGVFELSRMMGVSPWVWFADVLPETHDEIYVTDGESIFGPPSVKYRGMFINDEDWGMQPWAAKNMDPAIRPNGGGDMGPRTHERIFEMMLRTKSNYFWPAMHNCTKAFWFYKENPVIARKYQILLGGSHCDILLRDNEDEWRNNFVTEYPGVTRGDYNWNTNRNNLIRYWGDRIKESVNNPAVYGIGMRGIHDSGIEGYEHGSAAHKNALEDLFAVQRSMLRDTLGKPINQIPQLFIPYKEVLDVYNKQNLQVPEDVTIMWSDDNFGYVRRFSNPAEQARSGGGGVYFHFSYWGSPEGYDYLWLGTTSPAHISLEMSKAYDLNCKTAWIFNVGDIKPQEFEYQFAMDMAWDVERWKPENAAAYTLLWANETFGETLGAQIADIKTQYYHLGASGRPEHINWNAFSVAEMEQRIAAYEELVQKMKTVEAQIPERLKDAYFELIAYPVEASWAMNRKILGAKLSFEYAALGKRTEALDAARDAQLAYQLIQDLTRKYNKEIANGKWDGMMDYAPRNHSFFYDPSVVDEDQIGDGSITPASQDSIRNFEITGYTVKQDNISTIPWLGVGEASLSVLPLDLTAYSDGNITSAPYVEYLLPVAKGENNIQVKCFPTFPIYEGKSLRYAISIDGDAPAFVTVGNGLGGGNALGENARWIMDVRRSYTLGETLYQSDADKDVSVRIYFAEPGLVLSGLAVAYPSEGDLTGLLANPDFEDLTDLQQDGGSTFRGDPSGWTRTGTLSGNSFGVNNDAANYHGQYVCWYNSTPMPTDFELAQTINDLPPGEYILRCKLGVPANPGGITTQRLFAGNSVQYFGAASDYLNNLTAGESNTFANYAAEGTGAGINLREMAVQFYVTDTTDLKIGIRSSNKLRSGSSATNNAGWFKADHFRLERLVDYSVESPGERLQSLIEEAQALYDNTEEGIFDGMYPAAARTAFAAAIQSAVNVKDTGASFEEQIQALETLRAAIAEYRTHVIRSTSYITNPDFEDTQGLRLDGTNWRGDPYGWTRTGTLNGQSWGVNGDGGNIHGQYICWYYSVPMPAAFELYQQLTGIPAGKYTLKCRLVTDNSGNLTTQRLFANDNVQYFGREEDYDANLTPGEINDFAGWIPNGSFSLREMAVDVDVPDGNLRLGIRTSNQYKDGSRSASNQAGHFKVDHFRLELNELYTGVDAVEKSASPVNITGGKGGITVRCPGTVEKGNVSVYSLLGTRVYNRPLSGNQQFISLLPGVYIVRAGTQTVKVAVGK